MMSHKPNTDDVINYLEIIDQNHIAETYKENNHFLNVQSNFDGSNPFGTMKICSRQR